MPEEQYKYTFRLRSGSHHVRNENLTIEAGDLFHTNDDMAKLFGKDRWELVKEGQGESMDDLRTRIKQLEGRLGPAEPVRTTAEDLDSLSIKDLRKMAAEMEPPVDLNTCSGKTEIVNAIRVALDNA